MITRDDLKRNPRTSKSKSKAKASRKKSGISINPKIRERRQKVSKAAAKKVQRIVIACAVIATVFIAAIAFLKSSYLSIDSIAVTGNTEADAAEIIAASGVVEGEQLYSLDVATAAQKVSEVPWVETAEINRSWRGDVTIAITERVAVAALGEKEEFVLIDSSGRQLDTVEKVPKGVYLLNGAELSPKLGSDAPPEAVEFLTLLSLLPDSLSSQLKNFSFDDQTIQADFVAGGSVDFGTGKDLERKVIALETMLAKVETKCLESLDVSVPNAPAITRTEGCA